jgi:hypothetical protein
MRVLYLPPTEDTPEVLLEPGNKIQKIVGRSYTDNTEMFYIPIINWMVDYCALPEAEVNLHLKFVYLNTSTVKILIHLFTKLEAFVLKGLPVQIFWYYSFDDDDLLETGKEFSEVVNLTFYYIPYNPDDDDEQKTLSQ